MNRLPAYGKQVIAMRKAGHGPDSLYVVLCWNLAKAFPRVVIADDMPIDNLDLRVLAGLDVCLAFREKDAARVPELAQAILQAQPHILNAFNVDIPKNTILKNLSGEVLL